MQNTMHVAIIDEKKYLKFDIISALNYLKKFYIFIAIKEI